VLDRTALVDTIVVTRGAHPYLERVLDAVADQTLAPRTLTVVDVSDALDAAPLVAARAEAGRFSAATTVRTVRADRAASFSAAVTLAVQGLAPAGPDEGPEGGGPGSASDDGTTREDRWLWLLHDDSAPAPQALEALVAAVEHAPSVGLAGAKQVRWDEPDRLLEVGLTVSRAGRRLTGVEPGEIDQGQHDGREDVLAVGLAGALVRRGLWRELGGPDRVLGPFGDGLDLSVRARRAGHRVIVVPGAVVQHAQLSLHGLGVHDPVPGLLVPEDLDETAADPSFGRRLRSRLYWRVGRGAGWWAPLLSLWFVLAGVPRALWRVAVKQPRQALDEIAAPWWVLSRFPQATLARVRAARTARIPRRTLRPLYASSRDILAADRSQRLARAARRRLAILGNDLVRAERRVLGRRRRGALSIAVLGLLAVTGVALTSQVAGLLHGRHLVGGALLPASGSWAQWWQAVSSGWNNDGTGVSAPADGFVTLLGPVLALAGGRTQLAVSVMFVGALLVAGLGAWYASGAATRSLPVRLWATLVWVAAPVLLVGATSGRLGAMLVHALLPWLALALARALGVQRADAPGGHRPPVTGSLAALGGAGLAFTAVVASAPVLLVPGILALVVVTVAARGASRRSRLALWLVPLPALVVLAPTLVRVVVTWSAGGWRVLVADPGGLSDSTPAPAWAGLLGQPTPPARWPEALGPLAAPGPWLLGGLLVVLALVGLWRAGARGALARSGVLLAALGTAAAVVSARTAVSVSGGEVVHGWAGAGTSLAALGLLAAAAMALDGVGARTRTRAIGVAQAAVVLLVLVSVAVPLATLVQGVVTTRRDTVVTARDTVLVPAIGRQMQDGPRRARVLALERDDAVVAYQLLRSDGTQVTDSSAVVAVGRLRSTDDPVATVVAELVGGGGERTARTLQDYGVGAVLLPDATGDGAVLASTLDTVDGLQRATEGDHDLVWRVVTSDDALGQASWARVVGSDGTVEQLLAAGPGGVRDTVPAGPADRVLTVAETAAPGWRATLDGKPLPRVEDPHGLLAYRLGPQGGTVTVAYDRASRVWWLALQGGVLLVFTLLALPVRRRRGGSR